MCESIEYKLANTHNKMGQCCSLMLGEYCVEFTNNYKLVVKLGQHTCTYKQWQM